ncbi:uncharacterized protein PgNI_02063 [Pyricularia grisea]|uniref:Uncharacterized protein n=1 Tax=Pyricularia grisea TaxID=148305 RepID=A0A6P8BGI0_PYRGI|nr:uncharacterized protein PgNI_02063 [Pyricularia grisea]TLD15767.1 hypothetical protein PgNI_02063 [Pyricularia grisea]
MNDVFKCPFTAANQLVEDADDNNFEHSRSSDICKFLPGYPLVSLQAGEELGPFLEEELCCDDLETMAPYLWVLSTQSSANIRPLHRQRIFGRDILITESPRLHLVWYHNRIFIKPLPRYLMSYKFWTKFLSEPAETAGRAYMSSGASYDMLLGGVPGRAEKLRRAALGFIRTYRHLIRHESDFNIARSLGLIPCDTTWARFCAFVSGFDDEILDVHVSGRYHYGELRLTRLNFYSPLFLRRTRFQYLPEQYSTIFGRYFGPLLFVFGIFSVVLSTMQVDLAVQELNGGAFIGNIYQGVCILIFLVGFCSQSKIQSTSRGARNKGTDLKDMTAQ